MVQVVQQQPARPAPQQVSQQALQFAPLGPAQQQLLATQQHQQLRPAAAAAPLQVRAPQQQLLSTALPGRPLQLHHASAPLQQQHQQQQPMYILTSSGALQQLPMQVQQLPQQLPQQLHPGLAQPVTSIPLGARQLHPQQSHQLRPATLHAPAGGAQPQLLQATSLPMSSIPLGGQVLQLQQGPAGISLAQARALQPLQQQQQQQQQLAFAGPSASMQLLSTAVSSGGPGLPPQQLQQLRPLAGAPPLQLSALSIARPASQPQQVAPPPPPPMFLAQQQQQHQQQHAPQPSRATDLRHLQQQLAQQQQQQQLANLRARVASLGAGGGGVGPPRSTSMQPHPPPPPHSGAPPLKPGTILVSSQGPSVQQHPPVVGAAEQRVDQGLFLAQLIEQQQQQQQQQQKTRIGYGPRNSTGAPSHLAHPGSVQQQQLPELRLHDDDSVVFSEHHRPAPRNTSAPALPQGPSSQQSPNNSAAASGGRTPVPEDAPVQQQQLKSTVSDTNLQLVHSQAGNENGVTAAGNAPANPAAAAAAAATAALAQPIHAHASPSNGGQQNGLAEQQQEHGGIVGEALGAGVAGKDDLRGILSSIGVELARHGISVETAVGAGWLGVLSPADVKLLRETYVGELQRLQLLHSMPKIAADASSADGATSPGAISSPPPLALLMPPPQLQQTDDLGAAAEQAPSAAPSHEGAGPVAAAAASDGVHKHHEKADKEAVLEKAGQEALGAPGEPGQEKKPEAGDAERAKLEEQLQAASPAQFSAFEYGFFASGPGGAAGSELMECLEDLNQVLNAAVLVVQ